MGTVSAHPGLAALLDGLGRSARKRDLLWLGGYLGRLVGRRPFSYRHLYSVLHGSYGPSAILARALAVGLARLDGADPLAGHEVTVVLAPPGSGALGAHAQIEGEVRACKTPGCPTMFIANDPKRQRCYVCSPPRTRRSA